MPHDVSTDPLPLPSSRSVVAEPLSATELAAFGEQFRALSDLTSTDLDDVADDCIPASIGPFKIVRRLGSGGFGCVYLAYDGRLSRNVAIKVSHGGVHTGGQTRARFIHEARAAARLAHPNVVCLHEYGEEQGLLYLVYEMCEGSTLEDWIVEQTSPIPIRIAVGIVRELAQGLSHAHQHGLVHRDVKPHNVLLTVNCDDQSWLPFTPRITDFGLAHDWTSEVSNSLSARLVGTIDTMSPEQARGDAPKVTPAADQYSLGIILYRLLTGTVPFASSDVVETLQRICNEHPRSPRRLRHEVSRDLDAIVMTCLSKQPEGRYASCKELARDLDRFLRGSSVAARPLLSHQRAYRVLRAAPLVSALYLTIFLGSLASALTFSLMAVSLRSQQRELRLTLSELMHSEATAVRARRATETALTQVTEQKRVAELRRRQAVQQAYRADLHRAYEAWHKRNVLDTVEMLDLIRDDIEGVFEPCFGYQLLANQSRDIAKRLSYHAGPATEVRSIAGTDWVVSAGQEGRLQFHNASTGNLEFSVVPQPGCRIDGLDVSRDGTKIAVGYNSPTAISPYAKVYTLDFGNAECVLGEAEETIFSTTTLESLCFSFDGAYLALGQRYEPVIIRELATGQTLARIAFGSRNRSLDFSPDGPHCLILGSARELVLTDILSGNVLQTVNCGGYPQYARCSPSGAWLAYCRSGEPFVTLVSTSVEGRSVRLHQSRGVIEALDFSQDGRWLVAGTRRGGVAAWSLDQLGVEVEAMPGELTCDAEFVAHSGEVTSVCVVGNKWIASVSDSGSAVLNPLPRPSVNRLGSDVTMAVAVTVGNAACQYIVRGYRDGRVVMVGIDAEESHELIASGQAAVSAMHCSRDGRLAAVGWENGNIAIVDLVTRQVVQCGYAPPADSLDERKINSVAFNAEGTRLAACGDDARLRVWDVANPATPCWENVLRSYAYVTCFCGSRRVAVGGMFEEILIYDVDHGSPLGAISGASRTLSLIFDAERERLVSGHSDGRIRIHAEENWRQLETLNADAGEITSLVCSPDYGCYISGDALGHLKVWSAEHREFIGNLQSLPRNPRIASLCIDTARRDLMVFYDDQRTSNTDGGSGLNCMLLSGR